MDKDLKSLKAGIAIFFPGFSRSAYGRQTGPVEEIRDRRDFSYMHPVRFAFNLKSEPADLHKNEAVRAKAHLKNAGQLRGVLYNSLRKAPLKTCQPPGKPSIINTHGTVDSIAGLIVTWD